MLLQLQKKNNELQKGTLLSAAPNRIVNIGFRTVLMSWLFLERPVFKAFAII